MSAPSLVDWRVAERIAAGVAGGVGPVGAAPDPGAGAYRAAEIEAYCRWAREAAGEHSGLGELGADPVPELIDRRAWSRNAIAAVATAASALEQRVDAPVRGAGPAGGLVRSLVGGALGTEVGLAVGWVARRVVGQYDVALFGERRPPRLLFVAENLDGVRSELGGERETFGRWIALHEVTHVTQFERVDWLAPHLRSLAGELLDGAGEGLDLGAAAGRLTADPRRMARELLRGRLAEALATPAQRALLERLQATMAVVEGHAEHVMDNAGDDLGPGLAALRAGLDRRRERRGGIGEVFGRLLGMELKLRQYRLGKAFCDAVAERAGPHGLVRVWRSPEDLPTLGELERPQAWLERVEAAAPA